MKYTNLGRSGVKVSRICLGTMTYGSKQWREWVLDEEESLPFYRRAIELGINFFDTADMYSNGVSEEITGRALEALARRDEVVLATKVYFPLTGHPNGRGLSRKHIIAACEASLRRLKTDYIDLYQIHRFDEETPVEETLAALDHLVGSGKVLYLGASSMPAWRFAKMLLTADAGGWSRFVSMQNHYNLVYREEEREMVPLCLEEGIGMIPWSPLARGFLTGSRKRFEEAATTRARTDDFAGRLYFSEADFDVVDHVLATAKKREVPPAQVALAWLLSRPGVSAPIVGASRLQHLEDAVAALEVVLTEEEQQWLEEPYQPHPVLGF